MIKKLIPIFITSFFFLWPVVVQAECDDFEVSYINDNGGLDEVACYNTFKEAEEKMKENEDYVVRNKNSLSPTKIIAMNKGIAYSYPSRNNSSTLKIYQHPSERNIYYKDTYISQHLEMEYLGTERIVLDGGQGMIKVNLNGFEGYTDLEYTDLVPEKYLKYELPITLGGCDIEEPFTLKTSRNYYEVIQNGNYKDLTFTYHLGYPNNDGKAFSYTLYLCPSFDFLEEDVQYLSPDGQNFYKDGEFVGKGYNYYEFLPIRTKTNIKQEVFDNYIAAHSTSVMKQKGSTFLDVQERYGINALMLYSLAAHESAYGTSNIAKSKNNLFGWNAVDSSPGESASKFETVDQCIIEQASVNLRGYADVDDFRFFGTHFGNKGSGLNVKYASDPYWGMKIGGIMYRIDKSSKGFDGTLTDYNKEKLALITEFDAPVYKDNQVLFTTKYGDYYQKDFIVSLLDSNMIQTPNAIIDGKIYTHRGTDKKVQPAVEYSFENSVGKIDNKFLESLNFSFEKVEKDGETYISNISFNDKGLFIEGYSIIPDVIFNDVKHKLIIRDYNDEDHYFDTSIIEEDFQNGDGHTYKKAKFSTTIPFEDLTEGILLINSDNGNVYSTELLKNTNPKYSRQSFVYGNKEYTLFTNQLNNYRFELMINKKDIYGELNKPSVRDSLLSFDSIKLEDNKLGIIGQSAIYYTDYSSEQDISLILANEENVYTFDNKTLKCPIDYKPILGTEESLDYICFDLSADLTDIPSGEYSIFIKIKNGDYIDVVELTNRSGREIPLKTSNIRNRVILEK